VPVSGSAVTSAAAGPSVTDWISALSTLGIGVLGIIITLWQWYKTGFRPKLRSRMDARHEACELRIVNRGRGSGIIEQILVRRPDNIIVRDAVFEGFKRGKFQPLVIPALGVARVIIQAPGKETFERGITLLVGVGKDKPKETTPDVMPRGLGLYGLESILPPGTATDLPACPCIGVTERRGRAAIPSARKLRRLI
jgi:hypothetical protein